MNLLSELKNRFSLPAIVLEILHRLRILEKKIVSSVVLTVSGPDVDNTDPNNPVINSPVRQTITSGETTTSPSEDAMFDVLLGKANLVGGKVPESELPSYVDDVLEVADYASLPVTGESDKIYVTIDDNLVYRWTGSVYVEVSPTNTPTLDDVLETGSVSDHSFQLINGATSTIGQGITGYVLTEPTKITVQSDTTNKVEINQTSIDITGNVSGFKGSLRASNITGADKVIELPNGSGTLALSNLIIQANEATSARTLALSDAATIIPYTSSSVTITIPTNAVAPFPIGTVIGGFGNAGSVAMTIAGAGVTILGNNVYYEQDMFQLTKVAINTWIVTGISKTLPVFKDTVVSQGTQRGFWATGNGGFAFGDGATGMKLIGANVMFVNYSGGGFKFGLGTPLDGTTGTLNLMSFSETINPTSGTKDFNIFNVDNIINQTGGASGKVRGFYFNPTITAGADVRAVDIVTGKVMIALPVYADNTAALAGGLLVNEVYRTATGAVMVTY